MSNQDTLPRLIYAGMQLTPISFESENSGKWQWPNGEKEEREKAKISLVERGNFSRSVAFSLDMNDPGNIRARFPFLQDGKNRVPKVSRICDIIVLTQKDNALCAFVIEVKDSNTDNAKANIQIKNGVFFCEWLHRLLNEHCGIPKQLEIVRIISLAKRKHKSSRSRPTSPTPEPLPKIKTLQYNSNVKAIKLQEAYAFCKREGFLIAKNPLSK